MTSVHPTAIIDASATLGARVTIGPYAIVGAGVVLGDDVVVHGHAIIEGPCFVGDRVIVHPFAVVGGAPQDRTHRGEPTTLHIGDETIIREHVTLHRGTQKDRGATRVGRRCLLMVGVHVAHDALVGDDCVVANHCELAGHVVLEDAVVLGGAVALAPFVRVGRMAFVAAGARVERAVPPFVIAQGDRACVRGLNVVGLRRNGVGELAIEGLELAYKLRYVQRDARPELIDGWIANGDPMVAELGRFLRDHVTIPARPPR